ncbi:NAD(P)/FAD-dependent oxidoreductase [Pseudonocardia sp. ICBG1293]|uniref:flavin-containing monooxygenase n=1 Tax=Pseudonocardia sp. ICBG1293 TaxID=2844382 RepID=UPI001CC9B6E4|nr:NAD(P)/FAD-dependent oxidoreductase [Pseudonocardia sp. ICBG1293]
MEDEHDVVVVGAGVAGLYALHLLRRRGLRVTCVDVAPELGGVWHHQRFPGARIDTEGPAYQYLFSEELYRDWGWSERFPAGYEVLRWLRFVADRLGLHRDLRLSTPVTGARWDGGRWRVRTGHGILSARFLLRCTGAFTAPRTDPVPGRSDFAGPVVHTGAWPARGPGLDGLRVGVLGCGPSAVQLVPALVGRVGRLTVLARTPRYVLPAANPMYGWPERAAYRDRLPAMREAVRTTPSGTGHSFVHKGLHSLGSAYDGDPLALHPARLPGLAADPELRAAVGAVVRDRMRARLADGRLAAALVPDGDDYGLRPVATDQGWLESFHRDDVEVVPVGRNPVVRIRRDGVELADGTVVGLDAMVLATGFDPSATRAGIEVVGRGGRPLGTGAGLLGMVHPGFPNLFTPLAPTLGYGNDAACLQAQVEWVDRAVGDLDADGLSTIEAVTAPAEPVPPYAVPGGVAGVARACDDEAAAGYPSFERR